ncbi:MAG: outer membrane lipoprotein-sorting protein, partial [Cytophagales bacterium]
MKLKSVLTMLAVVCFVAAKAHTADEIIAKYFENSGGKSKWEAVKAVKKTAKVMFGGNEIPVINIQLKDGRQFTSY